MIKRLLCALLAGGALALTVGTLTAQATPPPATYSFGDFGTVTVNGHVTTDVIYATYSVDNKACTGTAFTADCAPQTLIDHVTIPAGDYYQKTFTINGPPCGPAQQDIGTGALQTTISYPRGTDGFLAGGVVQLTPCKTVIAPPVPVPATFTDQQGCDQGSYTIPAQPDGVIITVNDATVAPGTYPVDLNGQLAVNVQAMFNGEPLGAGQTHSFTPAVLCITNVTATISAGCGIAHITAVNHEPFDVTLNVVDLPDGQQPYIGAFVLTVPAGQTVTLDYTLPAADRSTNSDTVQVVLANGVMANGNNLLASTAVTVHCPPPPASVTPAPPAAAAAQAPAAPAALATAPITAQLASTGTRFPVGQSVLVAVSALVVGGLVTFLGRRKSARS